MPTMESPIYMNTLQAWEGKLGNPEVAGPLSFAAASQRDEREEFPREPLARLGELGLPALLVPVSRGGQMESLEQMLAASYAVGRRDPTVALAAGLPMWSHLAWMAGTPAQQDRVRSIVLGNGSLCLAASEAEHGADLLSCGCRAEENGQGYELTGEKWPIGCARTCRAAFVLARMGPARGPRALSWFLVDEDALRRPACRRLSQIPMLGLRGADLGGLAFDGLELGSDGMLGAPGAGFDLALKLFQLTRPLVAGLSLGPGDTALRLAADFALHRGLYGGLATELPTVRRALVRAWLDFQIAEVLLVSSLRGAHVSPERLSVGSQVAKIVAPMLVRRAIEQAAQVLGARFFFRNHAQGMFQKVYRDQSIAATLDGSTDVCLQTLAAQLPSLLAQRGSASSSLLVSQCAVGQPVPPLAYPRLGLSAHGTDGVLDGLDGVIRGASHDVEETRTLGLLQEQIEAGRRRLADTVEAWRGSEGARSPMLADAAAEYCAFYALGLCMASGICNRAEPLMLRRCSWLRLAGYRLLNGPMAGAPSEMKLVDELFDELRARLDRNDLLSAYTRSYQGPKPALP